MRRRHRRHAAARLAAARLAAARASVAVLLWWALAAAAAPPPEHDAAAASSLETIPVERLSPTQPDDELAPSPSVTELDAIVVTARRRQERAQDVPISLAVLDGDALGAAGLTMATDLQERVPGLVVTVPNPRLTSYTIRGLGSSSVNDGIESSVGLFLDGVYLGRQGLSLFDLVDLNRVEILRGPQGTLFGKNTTAGAINIVTKAPSHSFEANLEGTIGDYGNRQLRGSVNGQLFDDPTLAGRLTGYLGQRDGMIDNVYNGHDLNERNKWGLRGQLLWTPADDVSWRFIAEYASTDEECCVYPLIGPVREAVQARDDFMEYTRPSLDPYDRLADSDGRTRVSMRQKALSGEFTWDLGERHRLVGISAWRSWYFLPLNDDATSLDLASTSTLNQHRQLSQELRLDSNFETFDSVIGLYVLHQDLRGDERIRLGRDTVGWTFGGLARERTGLPLTETTFGPALYLAIPPATLDGTFISTPYAQQTDSVAAFGSADWHLTPRLDLTTGLRYTYEWRDSVVERSRSGGCPECTALNLIDPVMQLAGLSQYTVEGLLDAIAGGEYYRATRRNEGNFSGQVALSYKLAPNLMTYGSVARGYKGGGINLGFTSESIRPTFEPEEATAYEVGIKGQFFERRLSVALALYHTDIRDYQALTFDEEDTVIPNPRQINLLNVGKVRLRGVELDAFGHLFDGLRWRAGVAYSDAVTIDFDNAPNEDSRDNDKDLSGEPLYNAPRWSGTAGLEYGRFIGERLEAYGAVDTSFRSGYWGTVEHGRSSYIEGYSLTNLRLGLRDSGRRWDVWLWSRNVFDRDYVAGVHPLYGVGDYGAYAGDPRTVGLTARANFY
ncbi:MAG TPA: TonB-dependent receptor [Solimonas sp.]